MLLALDASSTVIGISIWDIPTKELISLEHFIFKEGSLLEKAVQYENLLRDLMNKYTIDKMVIEESLEMFAPGMSSSKTIVLLSQINILIQYVTYNLGIDVETISISKSRKSAFPDLILHPKKYANGLSHKEQCFNRVLETIGIEYFPTKTITRGKNKGDVVFEDWCMDMSDSYVLGKAFLNLKK
jgi:hypothetical protein